MSDKKFKQGDRIVLDAEVPKFANGMESVANVKRGDRGRFIRYINNYNEAVVTWDIHPSSEQYYIDADLISVIGPEPKETYTITTKDHSATFNTFSESKVTASILKEWGVKYTVIKNVTISEEIDI